MSLSSSSSRGTAANRPVLVTGGAGFIGSHTTLELLAAGHEVVVLDNLANSSPVALERVAELAGRAALLEVVDLREAAAVDRVFAKHRPWSVVHFAGLKAVGESTEVPLSYYQNNVLGTLNLVNAMVEHECGRLVFSSSCTVYGHPATVPVSENAPRSAENPYGRTKLIIEDILFDLAAADPTWRTVLLRYFNPVGAHESGRIGEDPRGIPNNLMPYVMQTAVGRYPYVRVFGDDYDTPDGTGVRDYIHVVDLAQAHLAALAALDSIDGCRAFNLGRGAGNSVLEVIAAAARAVGHEIPYRFEGRRPGDAPAVWADPSLAARELGWRATLDLDRMCADAWRWQQANPEGFG